MDLLYDPAMSLVPKAHAHYDLCFMPIRKHTLQCAPQFTLAIQFLFPSHLFFQADQNKCYGNKAILKYSSTQNPNSGSSGFSFKL